MFGARFQRLAASGSADVPSASLPGFRPKQAPTITLGFRRYLLLAAALLATAAGPLPADVVIAEFMASNSTGLADQDGDREDWIEILNDSAAAVDLAGWRLTDDSASPAKWVFPSRVLQPGQSLVVFASNKNRKPATGELHTNFRLDAANGEYLALHDATGTLAHAYAPAFPPQVADVSYGLPNNTAATYVSQGAACEVGVPVSQADYDANFANWRTSTAIFTGTSWQAGAHTGAGFDTGGTYGSLLGTGGDIQTRLQNQQRSACLRVPFTVADPARVVSLRLRMKWDDGFVAYLNGTQVAADFAPASPAWNSLSTGNRNEALNNDWTAWTIPAAGVPLTTGTNILAIHGFNTTVSSSDFLLLPLLEGTLGSGTGTQPPTWFTAPTPGLPNGIGGPVGPALDEPTTTIPRPLGTAASPPAVLTVTVRQTLFPVAGVRAWHRTAFGAESQLVMRDDGAAPDATAADGIFSATLPTTAPGAGAMLRWRFEALDNQGNTSRAPAYPDPLDSDQYYGTVALDADTDTAQIPVLHWFVSDTAAADTRGGTRASFFFLGEFYDNVEINLHGQSTTGFAKKSYDLDFNRDHRFLWRANEGRVKDINLLTNYADRTKARNTLSHEFGMRAATVHHFCFPVRVEQNGNFHGSWDMMEDADDRMIERNGLDPAGALYKMYNTLNSSTSNIEKKTRLDENNSDLAALITGLDPVLALATRRTFGYDHVNLPATVNYLATRQLNSDRDHGHKNYFLYRDSERTMEWRPVIWDVDLSQGHNWNGTEGYFDDDLVSNNPLNAAALDNRLYNLVYESPELRAMFLRRLRTLMDTLLQPPGTSNGLLETRLRQIAAIIDPDPANPSPWTDGDRDHSKWGTWGVGYRCREEVERVIAGYLAPRRTFLFDQNPATRPTLGGDPIPATPQTNCAGMVTIAAVDFLPASNTQQHEYIQLRNLTAAAVDLSGWTLGGAVEHVFEGGTVIPAGAGTVGVDYQGLLHVAKDAAAFRARPTSPRGGERRLVQGNYRGQLSARGETIELRDPTGLLIATHSYAGTPTPLQQHLRITEIAYNPAAPRVGELAAIPGLTGADFEFIEFANIGAAAITLTGATFTNGIEFTFPAATLAAGARILLARNAAALALRHGTLPVTVLGPFLGSLDGTGERLELVDAAGEVILDFTFRDGWYPATDGSGRSLVARDPAATPHDAYGEAEAWAISLGPNGSPGAADPQFAQAYHGWDNFHFTAAERADPDVSDPDADPDRDGRPNMLEYALGGDPRTGDAPAPAFEWSANGTIPHAALRFTRPTNALDLTFTLLAGNSLPTLQPVAGTEAARTPLAGALEQVILRDPQPATGPRRFLQLQVTLAP